MRSRWQSVVRALAVLASAVLCGGLSPAGVTAGTRWEHLPPVADMAAGPVGITADAAVLVDYRTGRVLWAKDAWEPRAPASTTKMMTALIALERGDLDQLVTVSPQAAGTPGSSASLRAGDRYTLRALLEAMLLRSGNDAAVAIAQHIAGSVPAFAALMNRRARAMGLMSTHFVNPHGLTEPFHYSSAYDLAMIARAGLRVPTFAAIVDSAERQITGYDAAQRTIVRSLRNTNRLLLAYAWVDGVKTGTTAAAGNCLVASGTRGGMRLIAAVLHSDDRWGDAVRLLQWGFSHFSLLQAVPWGAVVARIPVPGALRRQRLPLVAGGSLTAPVGLDELPRLRLRIVVRPSLRAPVRGELPVGRASLTVGPDVLATVPLLAGVNVRRAPLWARLWGQAWP